VHTLPYHGINSGPGDPRVSSSFWKFILVLGTSTSSLAANPLFACHDASHDVYQLEIISTSG